MTAPILCKRTHTASVSRCCSSIPGRSPPRSAISRAYDKKGNGGRQGESMGQVVKDAGVQTGTCRGWLRGSHKRPGTPSM
eukprot:3405439-Rhodomonas_salina.1